jgi:ABC-type transport system involved in multi-copper enzyme maturation permease subunit
MVLAIRFRAVSFAVNDHRSAWCGFGIRAGAVGVDLDVEAQQAVGLIIQPDQFPDRLFAPPKRNDLIEDGCNPVYDKEIRSEIFSQGTLMLRLVIQVSMVLAIPLMAVCLYIWSRYAAWYMSYVLLFNMLVGPVFSAGSVTSERERQTLDLLLTTVITPWQILWGKLVAGLRVSSVLTAFLLWPVLLACIMVQSYWTNFLSVVAFVVIVLFTCVTTAVTALFCSVVFRKTSTSLMTSYLLVIVLFCLPLAVSFFANEFFPSHPATQYIEWVGITSPFSATFAVPLQMELIGTATESPQGNWLLVAAFFGCTFLWNASLVGLMIWLFNVRWRVSDN